MTLQVIRSVKQYLASNFMQADDEWLSGCVEYLSQDSESNYTLPEIQNLAKEQWLLNDLKDICPGSLPVNLKSQNKTILNGNVVLQINAVLDIGTPAYQQYLKLQKVNTDNIDITTKFEDKVPCHRMIKLFLTDGIQDISGIEYKPMRNLSIDITPGCKVLIKGPVVSRKGVLLLTESSLELLGGEVQELVLSNNLPGLLSSKLGLSATHSSTQDSAHAIQPRNPNIPVPHSEMPSFSTPEVNLVPLEENPRPVARVTSLQVANTNIADDDIDFDQISAIEATLVTEGNKRLSDSDLVNPQKKLKRGVQDKENNEDDYPDENDLFSEEDQEYLQEMESKFLHIDVIKNKKNYPIKVDAEPFVYIKQINEMSNVEKEGHIFKVKAQILKLLSKLSVGREGWSLRCTLIDGTASIDVEFTSDVLSTLVGFTANEMNKLKREMSSKPELKEKAVKALQKAKDSLQVLYCVIELTILDVPKITALYPFEASHVLLLKKRLELSGE